MPKPSDPGRPADAEPTSATSEETSSSSAHTVPVVVDATLLRTWGPFRIIQKVGEGSFGEVYRAFDTTLEREVALKLLRPTGKDGESDRQAVLREARAMARVRHPNVVPVYGVDTHDGRVGFWSDFVPGQTLSALLAAQGPFGPREVAHIGVDLCRAVGAVHAAGLLHRDIKAGNAMREEGGRILLMDFGLTHRGDDHHGVVGTPAYMAPELLDRKAPSPSSDLYALGVLLFHLLTGKYPVEGSLLEISEAHRKGECRTLLDLRPDLPQAIAHVVQTAIHPEPEKRYRSAGQLIAALSEAAGLSGSSRDIAADLPPARPWFRPWMLVPVAALLVALAVPQVRRAFVGAPPPSTPPAAAREGYREAHELLERYYRPKALDTAIPLLDDIVQKDPAYAPAWADLGRANFLQFWQRRDNTYAEPARTASLRALALNPNLASVHVTLGMLHTETGEHDLAMQELSDALRLDSRNAEAHSALAELYYRQGRAADVEPTFQKSIDLDPQNWRLFNEFGFYYLRAGKFDLAAAQYEKAVALTPDNPRALNNLGIAYWRQDRLLEARDAFTRAIALEPTANRHLNLGRVLVDANDAAAAATQFERAVAVEPESYFAWGELASAYRRSGTRPAEMREALRKAIAFGEELRKTRTKDPALLADLALYYAQTGDAGQALPLARQAAAISPEDPSILHETAVVLELLHRREEALGRLRQALAAGRSRSLIERDPELQSLRADPGYRSVVDGAK